MKKVLFLLIAIILPLMYSCSSEEPSSGVVDKPEFAPSKIRSKEDAIKLAISHMEVCNQSRSGKYVVSDVEIVRGHSSRADNDTLIYAINFEDNKGFVLVSAAKTGEDIIGYNDESNLCLDENENPSFNYYMDMAKGYVADQLTLPLLPNPDFPIIPNPSQPVTTVEKVAPRVNLNWGQQYPEGMFCPNCASGCLQTACAMIMAYFKYPQSIELTYKGIDSYNRILNWEKILMHRQSSFYEDDVEHVTCTADKEAHESLGYLCRELGARNGADYSKWMDTPAYPSLGCSTMKTLMQGKCTVTDIQRFDISDSIFDFLYQKNSMALVSGWYYDAYGDKRGHSWVMCGGERYTTVTKGVLIDGGDEIIVKTYYYFNWGWMGDNNGYFAAGVFDPEKSTTPSKAPSRSPSYSVDTNLFWVYTK